MIYKQKSTEARRKILSMIHAAQTSHIASNFSVVDIATVLYDKITSHDEVVWSKGWASATIYYFLAQQGKIPKEDLDRFSKEEDGKIEYLGLAETNVPGVVCNGGSVGHGLPIACGIALAKKRANEKGNVFCILSDGELNEGTVWEAAMFAAQHKLDNLIAIVDKNGWQAMGKTEEVIKLDERAIFESFGWFAQNRNGHDHEDIDSALSLLNGNGGGQPTVFIFKTIKGKGVSFFEDHLLYHYKHVSDEEYEKAMKELI